MQRGDKAATVEAAAAALDADQLVVMPSARWYMLCGRADAEPVTRRMFAAKHRPPDRSLMLAVANRKAGAGMFSFTSAARVLANAFWPGDLALLLPWRDVATALRYAAVGQRAALVLAPTGALGQLCRLARSSVAMTSVNVSPGPDGPGTPPALTLDEVRLFIDLTHVDVAVTVAGGVCPYARDTSIVDATTTIPQLVRDGLVARRAIVAALAAAGHTFSDGQPPDA